MTAQALSAALSRVPDPKTPSRSSIWNTGDWIRL